jgi:hypothetical protein
MAANDDDLGSGGSILLPDSAGSAAHPHLLIGAGKEGTLYLVDRDNMGHYSPATNSIVKTGMKVIGGSFGTPAYFNHWIYYQGVGDVMKAFSITNGVMSSSPVSKSSVTLGSLGYAPVISAHGTSNAIAWVIDASAYQQGANNNSSDTSSGPAVLRAFNATNLAVQLYNSSMKAGDHAPGTVKYPAPVVADGKVFVSGDFGVAVYGLEAPLPVSFTSASFSSNGAFQLGFPGVSGINYVLQATTNLIDWTSLTTNQASNNFLDLLDPNALDFSRRFYRVLEP